MAAQQSSIRSSLHRLRETVLQHARDKADAAAEHDLEELMRPNERLTEREVRVLNIESFLAVDDYRSEYDFGNDVAKYSTVSILLGRAKREKDFDALRAYIAFPILCDERYVPLIKLMRRIHRTYKVAHLITQQHVNAYSAAEELLDTMSWVENRHPDVIAKPNSTRNRIHTLILSDMDHADAFLCIIADRKLTDVRDITAVFEAGTHNPMLADGVL